MGRKKKTEAVAADKSNLKNDEQKKIIKGKNGGWRPGSGKKPMQFTDADREKVKSLAGCGVPQQSIAALVGPNGIDIITLRKHFKRELELGQAEAHELISKSLCHRALSSDTLAIFYAKTQMRWRDVSTIEHTGPNGAPAAWTVQPVKPIEK